tara:strand:+ start:2066 stop:2275 length:210 start_codon:yes stop_codon:yes gene_type:complete
METSNKKIKVILYISILVIVWGSIASLIDLPFLRNSIYSEGDLGQYLTFSVTGFIFVVIGKNIYKRLNL